MQTQIQQDIDTAVEADEQTLRVTLPAAQWLQLQAMAERLNIPPEDLVRLSVGHLLAGPDESFQQAADYVLAENAELYRRLA